MRLAVVGSRGFIDTGLVHRVLIYLQPAEIVSGGAKGPDSFAEAYAKLHHIPCKIFKPDWSTGKRAGAVRNKQIVDYCDYLVAFWDQKSRGTLISIEMAMKANKLLKVYTEE